MAFTFFLQFCKKKDSDKAGQETECRNSLTPSAPTPASLSYWEDLHISHNSGTERSPLLSSDSRPGNKQTWHTAALMEQRVSLWADPEGFHRRDRQGFGSIEDEMETEKFRGSVEMRRWRRGGTSMDALHMSCMGTLGAQRTGLGLLFLGKRQSGGSDWPAVWPVQQHPRAVRCPKAAFHLEDQLSMEKGSMKASTTSGPQTLPPSRRAPRECVWVRQGIAAPAAEALPRRIPHPQDAGYHPNLLTSATGTSALASCPIRLLLWSQESSSRPRATSSSTETSMLAFLETKWRKAAERQLDTACDPREAWLEAQCRAEVEKRLGHTTLPWKGNIPH